MHGVNLEELPPELREQLRRIFERVASGGAGASGGDGFAGGPEEEEEEEEEPFMLGKHTINRQKGRVILLRKCPLCGLKISSQEEMAKMKMAKMKKKPKFFWLLQFGADMNNSGYESYACAACKKYFLIAIGDEPVFVKPNFVQASRGRPPPGAQQGPPPGAGVGPF
jgi:hypothetical protein